MSITVKICGINSFAALEACINYHADWIGLVFVADSPRYLSYKSARHLTQKITSELLKVGLFINPSLDELKQALAVIKLDYFQLHGLETPEMILKIKKEFKLPIIKAVAVETLADVEQAKKFYQTADLILFDTKTTEHMGGSGQIFDWHLLKKQIPSDLNWGLAGGLTPDNVQNAVKITGTKMVDVSSGVEKTRGFKDPDLIKQFIQKAKNVI